MADVQTKKGFTKIANQLNDAIVHRHFSAYEYRILLFLIRKTYGWGKKKDKIALSQFVEGTGIKKSHVSRTLGLLVAQNVITKGGNSYVKEWGVQKDFDLWKKLPKGVKSHHPLITPLGNEKGVIHEKKGVTKTVKGGNRIGKRGGPQKKERKKKGDFLKKTGSEVASAPSADSNDTHLANIRKNLEEMHILKPKQTV